MGPDPSQARARNEERRRQTIIEAKQLPAWWAAVMEEPDYARDFLFIALFTGMRRNEIASLRSENAILKSANFTCRQPRMAIHFCFLCLTICSICSETESKTPGRRHRCFPETDPLATLSNLKSSLNGSPLRQV